MVGDPGRQGEPGRDGLDGADGIDGSPVCMIYYCLTKKSTNNDYSYKFGS